MNKKLMLIVNPASSGGNTKRRWPEIMGHLDKTGIGYDFAFTTGPHHATTLCRESIEKGYDVVTSVGGDGTLNEVMNGFFHVPQEMRYRSSLGVISMGTGSDFIRTAGIPKDIQAAVETIARQKTHRIDVGYCRVTPPGGKEYQRYFINVLDAGLGGETAARVNENSKALGGFLSFLYGTVVSLVLYKNKEVVIQVDDREVYGGKIVVLAVGNGRCFGSGMKITPKAELDDALFDLVLIPDFKKPKLLSSLPRVYKGTHPDIKGVQSFQGKQVTITSRDGFILEIDGETPGKALKVDLEIVPAAIELII